MKNFSCGLNRIEQLPASLRSREGWAQLLELQRRSEPHLHQIEPTNSCIYRCIMCPRSRKMTRPQGFMQRDLYQKIIDEVANYDNALRSKEIELFHFGESLLHPHVGEMIEYASQQKLKISLSLNPPLLNEELTKRILQAKPHKLILCLDANDERTYQRIRGRSADFKAAISNIETLLVWHEKLDSDTQIVLRMIKLHLNQDQHEAFQRHWQKKGLAVELREFFPWNEKDLKHLGTVEKYPFYMPCPFPWRYLAVQWNGDVVPCCRDYNGVHKMGNVKDASLREIWNGAKYAEFRDQHRCGIFENNPVCRECMSIYYNEPA